MKYYAYWISPESDIYGIESTYYHIDMICDFPERFGFTKEYVKSVFDKYGESLHYEGFAREELMRKLLEKKWVRIRYRAKSDKFTVQIGVWDNDVIRNILNWYEKIRDHSIDTVPDHTEVKILYENKLIDISKVMEVSNE